MKTPEQLDAAEEQIRETIDAATGAVAEAYANRLRGGASALRSFAKNVEDALKAAEYDNDVVCAVVQLAHETADGLEGLIS